MTVNPMPGFTWPSPQPGVNSVTTYPTQHCLAFDSWDEAIMASITVATTTRQRVKVRKSGAEWEVTWKHYWNTVYYEGKPVTATWNSGSN